MSTPLESVIRFTLRQKVVANLTFVLLIVVGAFVLLRMPVERYPNIQFGKMYINTFLPGASPEEIETLITNPIEEALEDVEDLDFVSSTSYRERSTVVIKFTDDSDYRQRFDDVRLKVLSILDELPKLPEPPVFNFLDVNDWFPTISVNLSGDHSNATLTVAAKVLRIPLRQVDGVKEVKLSGDFTREFQLLLSPEKMHRYRITFNEAANALRNANVSLPAGHAETAAGEFTVRVDEQFRNRDDVLAAIIRTDSDGSFIRIGDIIEEGSFGYRDPFIIASVNGQPCVTLQILKSDQGNALFIAEAVRTVVAELAPSFADKGITLTVTQDSSSKIGDSVRVLGANLVIGVLLVSIIIWCFMGLRNAGLTTVGIPFAFLVTMVFMYLTGNSVNEVSLFAFVLVSGIIVDDAIVVVENIYRHLQGGSRLREAIVTGTAEVFLPVVAATLTTLAAFLPMLVMTGMVGEFFSIIPKTIAFALLASLLECLLVLPCHYLDFGPRLPPPPDTSTAVQAPLQHYLDSVREGRLMTVTRRLFNHLLRLALRFRVVALGILTAGFLVSLYLFGSSMLGFTNLVRIQFFPENYALYNVELQMEAGTPIKTTDALVRKMAAAVIAQGPAMNESALGFAGFYIREDFSPQHGNHLGHVAVTLPESRLRRFADYPKNDVVAHLDTMRQRLAPLIPAGTTMTVRPEKDGPPAGKDVNIRVLGIQAENVSALAKRIDRFLRGNPEIGPWLTDLQDDQGSSNKVFRIRIDRQRVAEYRLEVAQVARLAAAVMNGEIVGEMKLPEELIDIKLKTAINGDETLLATFDLVVLDYPGGTVRLGDLCHPEYAVEPGSLNRFQQQRAITLTANLKTGASLSSAMVVKAVSDFHDTIRSDYPGAELNFSGEHESTRESFLSLAYAFALAIMLIYLILAAQFRSYLQPFIIISAVVFALTGVIYGAFFTRTIFTINSFVAVVGVTGVVVNDSLMLVEFLNSCYQRSRNRQEVLLLATNIRLRPILLTTLTTTLGLLPMALGIPEYSLIWGSMAMTFVTGLCTATLLTIVIVPVQWDILMSWTERLRKVEKMDTKV